VEKDYLFANHEKSLMRAQNGNLSFDMVICENEWMSGFKIALRSKVVKGITHNYD